MSSKFVEISQCSFCPWLCGDVEFTCNNPETLDRKIKDISKIPEWCPLDELCDVEEEG